MIKIKSRKQLKDIIQERIEKDGNKCNLNDLDVSNITNMSNLFYGFEFNGYIDKWDVSNVKNMKNMFRNSEFNNDISKWDVSKVKNMSWMFYGSFFNQDISRWNTKNVKDMSYMFRSSEFNQDISNWDVSNVVNMFSMFYENESNLSEIKKSVCKWKFNPKVVLVGFMNNPKINSLEDLENKICKIARKREQILKRIGSFRDFLDI